MNTVLAQPDIDAVVDLHFKINSFDRRYDSPSNRAAVVKRMRSFGLTIPSDTGVARAIKELVAEEIISRADGGNEASDRAAAKAAEQARMSLIANAPLTTADYDYFSQTHPDELSRRYHSDRAFAARYEAARRQWDSNRYQTMPAVRIISLYRSDKGFKRAVDRLIRDGKI